MRADRYRFSVEGPVDASPCGFESHHSRKGAWRNWQTHRIAYIVPFARIFNNSILLAVWAEGDGLLGCEFESHHSLFMRV